MKALVKSRAERGLWLEEIAEPAIGINDVLIRVRRAGICGTDVHIYNWDEWAQRTIPVPMAIGHEFAIVTQAMTLDGSTRLSSNLPNVWHIFRTTYDVYLSVRSANE